MPSKPSNYLNWNPSQSNCIQPSGGQSTSGWQVGQMPPSQYENYLFNLVDRWIQWLDFASNQNPTSVTVTGNYTAQVGVPIIFANPSGAPLTVTLPDSASNLDVDFIIKNINYTNANAVTIALTTGSDKIENQSAGSSITLGANGETIRLHSNGAGVYWQVST